MKKRFSGEQIVAVLKQGAGSACSGGDSQVWDQRADLLSMKEKHKHIRGSCNYWRGLWQPIQAQICNQLFQPAVLFLELFHLPSLIGLHANVLVLTGDR
jgi:hypothetical protein